MRLDHADRPNPGGVVSRKHHRRPYCRSSTKLPPASKKKRLSYHAQEDPPDIDRQGEALLIAPQLRVIQLPFSALGSTPTRTGQNNSTTARLVVTCAIAAIGRCMMEYADGRCQHRALAHTRLFRHSGSGSTTA